MLVICFQVYRFNVDLGLELLVSFCQLWFSPTAGRLCWRPEAWRGKKIPGEGRYRSFPHPSSSGHSYARGFSFSWPSQRPQHSICAEGRPGPYRCSTMCGASRYTGPTHGHFVSPHLLPGVPLAPGVVDASCNSCYFSAYVCSGHLPTCVQSPSTKTLCLKYSICFEVSFPDADWHRKIL